MGLAHRNPKRIYCCYDRLCLSGTAAANGPYAHAPDGTRVDMDHRCNDINRENWKTRWKTCPCSTSSTSSHTRTDLGSKPSLRGEKPEANRLSYGTGNEGIAVTSWGQVEGWYWSVALLRDVKCDHMAWVQITRSMVFCECGNRVHVL
jgi:hypothetical protein